MYTPALGYTAPIIIDSGPVQPYDPYDRTPPRNIADFPKCATQAIHDTAHKNCRPEVIRGLGLLELSTANPCWVETLPICPPILRTPPRLPPPVAVPAPAPVVVPKPTVGAPKLRAVPPRVIVAPPNVVAIPPPSAVTPVAPGPARAGFTTGGLLAIAAAVGVGGWLLFGRKKKAA